MTAIATQLPAPVQNYLSRYELRRGLQRVVRRAGLALLITLVWVLVWCMVDRLVALPAPVRVILLLIDLIAVAAMVGGGIVRLLSPGDLVHVARDVERREPRWREKLATVTSRALGQTRFIGSKELLDALASEVAAEAQERDPQALLPWLPVMRPWTVSAIVVAIALLLALAPALDLPRLLRRYLTPLADVAPAATTRLLVSPGDVKVPAGESLRVRATAQRLDEGGLTLHLRVAGTPGQDWPTRDWTEQPMSAGADGTFDARAASLERDVEYFVTGGDARSDIFRATVLRRPAVLGFHWTISYPPYLKLAVRQFDNDDGLVEAPFGSEVTLQVDASEPLLSASIELGGQTIAMTATANASARQVKLTVRDNLPLQIHMTSAAGVEGRFVGGRVHVLPDRAPVVVIDLLDVHASSMPSPIKLRYQAADDFGVARLDAEVQTLTGEQRAVSIPLSGDEREQRGVFELDPATVDARPGDELRIRLRGEDRGGQFAVSPPVRVIVGSGERPKEPKGPAPSSIPTTEPAPAAEPAGFGDAIHAYFEAISPVGNR